MFTRVLGITYSAFALSAREGYGFEARPWYRGFVWQPQLGLEDSTQNQVITKDVKSCTYCCYVKCATLIVRVGGNALAPNRCNLLPCTFRTFRQRSCNRRVVCLLLYVVVWLRSMMYRMGLWTSARCVVWSLVVVRTIIEIKYPNIPQIHMI